MTTHPTASPPPSPRPPALAHHHWWVSAGLLLLASTALFYLPLARLLAGEPGYPLDDAWIHQTYARNFAQTGRWAYVPGTLSAGSTAPLWTILLSIGHLLPTDPRLWSYALGLACLGGTAWAAWRLSRTLFGSEWIARLTALALLTEWHMGWAALSGMEIPLYAFLATLLLASYIEQSREDELDAPRPLRWGLLGGLLTLTRPEGLWLMALIGLHQATRWPHLGGQRVLSRLAVIGTGWALVVTPYALFNWQVTGSIFPSTFHAKQREYAELISALPLWRRLLQQAWLPWIGGQVVLLGGLLGVLWQRRAALPQPVRAWQRATLLPALWALGIIVVYAARLPVTYQHGRYLMPLIPALLVYGIWGMVRFIQQAPRLIGRTLGASAVVLFAIFWFQGGFAYARDSTIITCEMVGTARWLDATAAPTDLIAAHDIGAIGYFAQRPLLDLAGLVTPETIPILRDEQALLAMMRQQQVRYVVTFPDWYREIPASAALTPVAQRQCEQSAAAGQPGMVVYITDWAQPD